MGLLEALQGILGKIVIAVITILAGFIIAKLANKITKRVLAEAELNRILQAAGIRPFSDAIGTIVEYVIYVATVLVVLQQFGLTSIVLGILTALVVIILAFSLLITIRDFIPNALVGMFLRKKLSKHIGKKVQIGSIKGKLETFGIVGSVLRDKDMHYVPHLYTSKQKITPLRAN